MRPELEEFAELLMRHVRDYAIQMADINARPDARGPTARRWRAADVRGAETIIPDVVDNAIFALLHAIDEGDLRLEFISKDGARINLEEDGMAELAGEFIGSDGWRARYSRERFVDDLADPTNDPS
jgi:hypothetical protein